jgi:hypothetical protein
MMASIILFALTIAPNGYVLSSAFDDTLVSLAANEFEQGKKWRHDAAKARPRFREAARLYDELWRRGVRDPNLALNRANARRLAGDLPGAILALNEGLSAARWNRPLQMALEDARAAVAYPASSDLVTRCRPLPSTTIGTRLSPFEAWIIAALFWFLACGGLARFAMTRAGWWLVFAGVWLTALAVLGGLWLQDDRISARHHEHALIVVADDVALRKGNSESYPLRLDGVAKLPKGVEARELTRRGGWVQIRLADGVIGWIPEAAALKTGE